MSDRGRRTVAGTIGTLLAVAMAAGGCSLHHPDGSDAPPPPSGSVGPPVGSVTHPRPVECSDGATATPGGRSTGTGVSGRSGVPSGRPAPPSSSAPDRDTGQYDVTVGPLTLRGLRAMADGNQYTHGVHNSEGWHYLVGTAVRAGADVTVTIGTGQRARAGLEFGGVQGMTPAPAVTFHGCPGAATTFLGAFFVAGDGRACVPLDIRVGDGTARRVVISFYDGRCPA